MAGEWTVAQLKDYIDLRLLAGEKLTATLGLLYDAKIEAARTSNAGLISALQREIDARHEAVQLATDKAEHAQHLRNESMNEFRGQLKDQASLLPTRIEVDGRLSAQEARLARLEQQQMQEAGKDQGKNSITGPMWGIAGAVLAAVIAAMVMSSVGRNADRIGQLEQRTIQGGK